MTQVCPQRRARTLTRDNLFVATFGTKKNGVA